MLKKCLGPDSNRHGVAPKGFSYHYSFHCCMRGMHLWSGLYLHHPAHPRVPRIRQEPSSLYTFLGLPGRRSRTLTPFDRHVDQGLARYCRHLVVRLFHRL